MMHASHLFNSNSVPPSKQAVSMTTEGTVEASPKSEIDETGSEDDEDDTVELEEEDGADKMDANARRRAEAEDEEMSVNDMDGDMTGDESEEEYERRRMHAARGADARRYAVDDDEDDDEDEDENEYPGEEEDVRSEISAESVMSEDSDDPDKVDSSIAEEMERFATTFKGFERRYRLVNKIGEGMEQSNGYGKLC
jgi:cell division control protein 7